MSAAATAETKPVTLNTAYYITQCLLRSIGYAEGVLKDIPADKFAFKPSPGMNHPAFVIGHLSLYPNRIFTLLDKPTLIVNHPGWQELFQAGAPCLDDGAKYPAKDVIAKAFFDGYRKVAEALPGVDDDVLRRDNPIEGRFREVFPKIGTAVNFMCNNHLMMHLGQISTWRRAVGLGPAM